MSIDDPVEVRLKQLRDEAAGSVEKEGMHLLIVAALAQVPVIGTPIVELVSGLGQRRVQERSLLLPEEMKRLVDDLEKKTEEKIDRSYFSSEEFQTILYLALQGLNTAHHERKVKALAAGLVNSGRHTFSDADKNELFMRAIIDLMPAHLEVLEKLHSADTRRPVVLKEPEPEQQMILQRLVGYGMVESYLERTPFRPMFSLGDYQNLSALSATREIEKAVRHLNEVPSECFRINSLGEELLAFVGSPEAAAATG
jgi:hypothetical protein